MNIYNNYVSVLVYFRQLSYEGLQLSYIQHKTLDTIYEFTIYVYSMRSLTLILTKNILEYFFISVCSFICVHPEVSVSIKYDLNMKD